MQKNTYADFSYNKYQSAVVLDNVKIKQKLKRIKLYKDSAAEYK